MKKYFAVVLFCLSCGKKDVAKNEILYNVNGRYVHLSELNVDSISPQLYDAISSFVNKQEIPQIKELDIIEQELYEDIKAYKDSILADIDPDNIKNYLEKYSFLDSFPPYRDNFSIAELQKVLKYGDIDAYYTYMLKDITIRQIDYYQLCLYFAENFKFAPAYKDVFYALRHQSYINSKRRKIDKSMDSFDCIDLKLRKLAFYCIIKAYKDGCIYTAKTLAYYFERGLYLPKRRDIANKLYEIDNVSV